MYYLSGSSIFPCLLRFANARNKKALKHTIR
jgi:hypothetical protein